MLMPDLPSHPKPISDLSQIPPAWLKQVEYDPTLDGATLSSYLAPGEIIADEVGGELWSVYSLKAYCTARFGKPQAYGAWLLATEVPDFYILAKPRADSGLMVSQFAYRLPEAMNDTLYKEWSSRITARIGAWEPYRDQAGLVPPQKDTSSREEQIRHSDACHALYATFVADGSEARALATAPAPLTEAVEATIRNVARELMRPVDRPGHGRRLTIADTKNLRAAPAP